MNLFEAKLTMKTKHKDLIRTSARGHYCMLRTKLAENMLMMWRRDSEVTWDGEVWECGRGEVNMRQMVSILSRHDKAGLWTGSNSRI